MHMYLARCIYDSKWEYFEMDKLMFSMRHVSKISAGNILKKKKKKKKPLEIGFGILMQIVSFDMSKHIFWKKYHQFDVCWISPESGKGSTTMLKLLQNLKYH